MSGGGWLCRQPRALPAPARDGKHCTGFLPSYASWSSTRGLSQELWARGVPCCSSIGRACPEVGRPVLSGGFLKRSVKVFKLFALITRTVLSCLDLWLSSSATLSCLFFFFFFKLMTGRPLACRSAFIHGGAESLAGTTCSCLW